MHRDQHVLSVHDAACAIYGTEHPSEQQLSYVRQLLHSGVLQPSRRGRWTTTAESVAEYLTRESLRHAQRTPSADSVAEDAAAEGAWRAAQRALHRGPQQRAPRMSAEARELYGQWLRDYFLAVVLRRKAVGRSEAFQRAVIVGQVVFVALVLSACLAAVRAALAPPPPGQEAVQRWLAEHTEAYRIETWFPAEPGTEGGLQVRVQYRYRQRGSGKFVWTDRLFQVVDDRVVSVQQVE